MNVLILTPDRVGSTLLQRLITVYMSAHEFDKPVINLHELTNGLIKYYSPTFNAEVLGKSKETSGWKYHQSLEEIVGLLDSVEHYKTARLARYHIQRRQDKIEDQIPFYDYLNNNFYIIAAQRKNLLEHAISWSIVSESKKLNVFRHQEKIDAFKDIYQNKITMHPKLTRYYLDQYVEYLTWADTNFNINSYFNYEEDLPRVEEYILGLSIFNNQSKKKTWQDIFNIDFKDWNRCHYLLSDLSGVGGQLEQKLLTYTNAVESDYQIQSLPQSEIANNLTVADQKFLLDVGKQYKTAYEGIEELLRTKVLVSPIPIKLQTMLEKKMLIKNFDEIVDVYNEWVAKTGVGVPYTDDDITCAIESEIRQWHGVPQLK